METRPKSKAVTNKQDGDTLKYARYKIESFKTTSAKRVPYKQIDYSIYKPSAIVFSTSEERHPKSIEVRNQPSL